ncbi:MAG: hypothetical protein V4722_19655 [Bacteroidota bacterium]
MKNLFSFITIAGLLLCAVLFTTCQKEYSYEGGMIAGSASGTAVYTFDGAGAACTGSVVSGNYYTGTVLNLSNTVELQVIVTTAGTYQISTNTINGFSFSASGTFSATGPQTITLIGNGTPVAEGSFSFTTPVSPGCSFTVSVTKAPVIPAAFTLAGAPNNCEDVVVKGRYFPGVVLDPSNTVDIKVNVTTVGAYTLKTDTINGISFSKTGSFTTTGVQTITLAGSGTPLFPRNLVFTPLGGTSSCTFSVTVENPAPLATYVLESGSGSPNPCIYTVAGTYNFNTPLTTTNTVSMRVFVTVVGNFTIATNTVNGMLFSHTGTFTGTGSQSVVLTGSGTPIAPGTFTLTPGIVGPAPLGGAACAISITVN